jgi:hypothetical protein
VTSVQLLPIHTFAKRSHLLERKLANYRIAGISADYFRAILAW